MSGSEAGRWTRPLYCSALEAVGRGLDLMFRAARGVLSKMYHGANFV